MIKREPFQIREPLIESEPHRFKVHSEGNPKAKLYQFYLQNYLHQLQSETNLLFQLLIGALSTRIAEMLSSLRRYFRWSYLVGRI